MDADDLPPEPTPEVAAALANYQNAIATTMDMLTAYRAALIGKGFSPEAAEQMTVDYHRVMVGRMK